MPAFRSRIVALLLGCAAVTAHAETPVERARGLVAKMTLDEKIGMVHGWWYPPTGVPTPGMPTDWLPSAGYVSGIPRLGIPTIRESDASLGVANQVEERKGDTETALPSSLSTAASFDPEVARAGGAMIGAEARARRFNVLLAGGVNLTRDPWGGRDFEYMGEDPLLAGRMAGAAIDGIQSNHIVSTVKHYVLNAQETGRFVLNARLAEAPLRESDMLAFKIAIEEGRPGSVMCAYNRINGDFGCENAFNLTHVLKDEWHYPGWVMSDWGAVHSTEKAALAGLDQQSGQQLDPQVFFGKPLKDAVQAGRVPQARLDDMVTRILTGMITTGALDHPLADTSQPINWAAHADVAQKAAEAGIVLLKNDGGVLPLAAGAKRIVVIGAHADVGVLSGGGSSQVRSRGGVPVELPTHGDEACHVTRAKLAASPLKAIQALAPNATVTYLDGSDPAAAAKAAASADVALVFAWHWRSEAQDAETLALPDNQDALIAAVAKANPKTAVVLESGGPVLMPWLHAVPAVVEAWYAGQRGGEAIANVLFGKVDPSGRLPMTFPASPAQAPRPEPVGLALLHARDAAGDITKPLPPFDVDYPEGSNVGYRWYQAKAETPLFAFGHGLAYTSFRYAGLSVAGQTARFTVTNTGERAGTDVPQLYVEAPDETGLKTYRLAGWSKLTLAPGETRSVTVKLDARVAAVWHDGTWSVPAAPVPLVLGHDATNRALATKVTLALPAAR